MSVTVSGAEVVVVSAPVSSQTIEILEVPDPQIVVQAVEEARIVQMTAANSIVVSQATTAGIVVSQSAVPPVNVVTSAIQGPPAIAEDEVPYAKRVDFIGDTDAYVGEATPGTAEAAAAWRIKKLTFVGDDVETRWAAGAAQFVHAWTDRLTLTYS